MPTPPTDTHEATPDRIALLCDAGDIMIEATGAEDDVEASPRFTMVAYTGGAMRIDGCPAVDEYKRSAVFELSVR